MIRRTIITNSILPWLICSLVIAACGDESTSDPATQADATAGTDTVVETDATDQTSSDGSSDTAGATEDVASADTTNALPPLPTEWSPQATDFDCLTSGRSVRGFWLANPLGPEYEDEAVRIADAGMMESLPPGTIIQLIPQEAMVKLLPGADPETGDWEYFNLAINADGTTITERGGAEVSNGAGSCLSCHAGAIERDYVCEQTGLCAEAAIPRVVVDALVGDDARCE
jgi:hypothetical protein